MPAPRCFAFGRFCRDFATQIAEVLLKLFFSPKQLRLMQNETNKKSNYGLESGTRKPLKLHSASRSTWWQKHRRLENWGGRRGAGGQALRAGCFQPGPHAGPGRAAGLRFAYSGLLSRRNAQRFWVRTAWNCEFSSTGEHSFPMLCSFPSLKKKFFFFRDFSAT